MLTRIQKWGNSQGIRFPRQILRQAQITTGEEVDISAQSGEIVIKPVSGIRGKYRLKDLLLRMPEDYKPGELGWGPPQGKEMW
ncbi:MAG: transcriptional regulator/antitoxin, MazE [Candidatus Raymondbacteria bacterium RifOxyA12_full_50_37]|uniref:Transcriptional regulator/antitoxin, MazE n=1 Tax=Candidatus Raymondbacteria bacterium RIFOXYD12_FULL_49_13 TaxID=1817890 RepID=A0A1F7F242_UNCRA|nr:MAG: transcriptional regulator/antitoxin, MazE [Candidatus Raymondbacteria bacterium RifOxyA12_full_50_37]OGJ92739.1 MAG: transcriptional regulator/antitoxin, MazE [Candidatus Raymondbacteria bacterium RIFOXYA2_FULL_49_16]OGK00729.1 MAG: transcriptional regulator/antitoxin, MazE [Candidatus Raymondbacteria bacterium RIFOXYD12_FULL_49_13]OGK04182.1 MAG: transcriptional regulator/antitoxin, MazE [Candidatus Raymondbacteria bacterium RifOxyB12_full_50_8]OGP44515.1 MAG: transcriptional regulator